MTFIFYRNQEQIFLTNGIILASYAVGYMAALLLNYFNIVNFSASSIAIIAPLTPYMPFIITAMLVSSLILIIAGLEINLGANISPIINTVTNFLTSNNLNENPGNLLSTSPKDTDKNTPAATPQNK